MNSDPCKRTIPTYEEDTTILSDRGAGEIFANVLERRLSRRGLLKSAGAAGMLALIAPVAAVGRAAVSSAATSSTIPTMAAYKPIPSQPRDTQSIAVAAGHTTSPLLKWGDPIHEAVPEWDPYEQTPAKQAMQFGYNCDYIGWHPIPFHGPAAEHSLRSVLWVNHEYTNPELMFANYDSSNPTQNQVDVELEAHGGTIVEVVRGTHGPYSVDRSSPLNRRITGTTPHRLSGPAASHDWLKTAADPWADRVLGTLNNCAGGFTPWGTILTAEENFHQYFANLNSMSADDPRREVHQRYGLPAGASERKWERFHGRFDIGDEPNEPFRFGWVVEINPYDPDMTPIKRTALGRFRHEGATFGSSPSGRVAFYSGDDQVFEYMYKFVSDHAYDPQQPGAPILDHGVLYVAKLNEDGSGEWLPLVYGHGPLTAANGFTSQGDVLVKTRLAADALGATKMDRPEDMQQNPINKKIYVALTNNSQRGGDNRPGTDAANPRVTNRHGHILEITETDDDCVSTTFTWDIFILCGDPADESTYFGGFPKELVSPISSPDNVNFDNDGNLWISTDGAPNNGLAIADGLYSVPTAGPERGYVKLFLSVVAGAECASFDFSRDNRHLFVAVQHPGEGGTVEDPVSLWPDNLPFPRPTVLQVWADNGGKIGNASGGTPQQL